jgi:hypothetical protein
MINETSLKIIQTNAGRLIKPVRLIVFTKDTGCKACPAVVELAHAIKDQMGKIALETYDLVMDRDKTEQYGVTVAPALIVQGGEGQTVTFYGLVEHIFLEVLLNAIHAVSDAKVWFPADIRRSLSRLSQDVNIRVFVESNSQECRFVADTAIGLALESEHINTDIIMAGDFPELIKKYNITTLPKTIFGENMHVDGNLLESDFLEMIFQAEGIKPGPDRRCLVCGGASPDIMCSNCKTRIQAETLEHKLKAEKQK